MATLNQVTSSLARVCASSKPANIQCSYFPGFPLPEKLKAALLAGKSQVSVFPIATMKRVKGYVLDPQDVVVSSVDGETVISREVSRKIRHFQIHVWSPSWDARDEIGEAIVVALDSLAFLPLYEGNTLLAETARHLAVNELEDDAEQAARIYHRIYTYSVEYSTTSKKTYYNACHPRILNRDGQVFTIGSGTSILVSEIE